MKCPILTVSRLVKTLPNSCVTSQMKVNTNCSFSCPQGYQLHGPSYKQCGSRGRWTDGAKSVLCTGELKILFVYKYASLFYFLSLWIETHNSMIIHARSPPVHALFYHCITGCFENLLRVIKLLELNCQV